MSATPNALISTLLLRRGRDRENAITLFSLRLIINRPANCAGTKRASGPSNMNSAWIRKTISAYSGESARKQAFAPFLPFETDVPTFCAVDSEFHCRSMMKLAKKRKNPVWVQVPDIAHVSN